MLRLLSAAVLAISCVNADVCDSYCAKQGHSRACYQDCYGTGRSVSVPKIASRDVCEGYCEQYDHAKSCYEDCWGGRSVTGTTKRQEKNERSVVSWRQEENGISRQEDNAVVASRDMCGLSCYSDGVDVLAYVDCYKSCSAGRRSETFRSVVASRDMCGISCYSDNVDVLVYLDCYNSCSAGRRSEISRSVVASRDMCSSCYSHDIDLQSYLDCYNKSCSAGRRSEVAVRNQDVDAKQKCYYTCAKNSASPGEYNLCLNKCDSGRSLGMVGSESYDATHFVVYGAIGGALMLAMGSAAMCYKRKNTVQVQPEEQALI